MNTDSGRIYSEPEAIKAAMQRREPVVPVTQDFASYAQCHSAAHAKRLGRALANIQRTQPNLGLHEQQELAKKAAAVR